MKEHLDGGGSPKTSKIPFKGGEIDKLGQNDLIGNSTNAIQKSWDKDPDVYASSLYRSNNLFSEEELREGIFDKRFRYGVIDPYHALVNCREFLFFTKPDLNIITTNNNGVVGLQSGISKSPFWNELYTRYPKVISALQSSYGNDLAKRDPFNHLLENMVQTNLDIPGASSENIETAGNVYGISYTYKGSSEASDYNFDFSLEFKDTANLPIYYFFKAYEQYEIAKHHGIVRPKREYLCDHVLYDQYAIFKFLVAEDMETIVYYAKYYGVKSKNLPRDVFNATSFDNGLSYSIDFNAAFVEDMNPYILTDFNALSKDFYNTESFHEINVFDSYFDRSDMRPARAAYIVKETNHQMAPGQYVYKLKWRGDDAI